MNRRDFLSALAAAVAAPAIPGRRIYSFLWDNPLVQRPPFFGVNRSEFPVRLTGSKVSHISLELFDRALKKHFAGPTYSSGKYRGWGSWE